MSAGVCGFELVLV